MVWVELWGFVTSFVQVMGYGGRDGTSLDFGVVGSAGGWR
jgi:hypothetical protein